MARQDDGRPRDGRWIGGIILIIIGVVLLVGQWLPDVGRYAPLAIGLALTVIFIVTRNPGALIGGSIVTGIGAGIVLDQLFPAASGGWVPLGLGLGFLGIWAAGTVFRLPEARVWPLIPGAILTFVGVAQVGGAAADALRYAWPVVLILLGVAVIAGSRRRQPPPLPFDTPEPPREDPPSTAG